MTDVNAIIEDLLREHLGSEVVQDVFIRRVDAPATRLPVFVVDVVYDTASGTLDPSITSSIVRHARERLADVGETPFPVFSFIASSEERSDEPTKKAPPR